MSNSSRRGFLQTAGLTAAHLLAAGPLFPEPFARQASALKRKVKITDVKCMIVHGTWDWNLIKIETDAGVYGIGEAYWGWGVKDLVINKMKGIIVGEDPLNVDKLYTKMLMQSAGAGAIAGVTMTAASGIEIALWDLAGRLLGTPVCNLLGGRFRDRVRFYRTTQVPKEHPAELSAWRELVQRSKAERWGWTAFKFQGDGVPRVFDPDYKEPGHDPYLRNLTRQDIGRISKIMEAVREELGPGPDMAIECHWRYDTRDVIDLAKALEPVKPMWLEDPVPPDNPETMAYVRRQSPVPICTGENLYGFAGFEKLIELQGTAAHNPASPVGTIASAHAASAMRNFRIHELANWIDWWPDLVVHEGPIWENGYFTIQDKPGLGIEINQDVARAHLAPGETWWG
jgi:L-alanine-DL-glutamate epimerase-like enolase superfamily enzyme